MEARGDEGSKPPPTARQRTYIVDNGDILDLETKKAILNIVMQEVGTESVVDGKTVPVVMESATSGFVSINLDAIDPDVLTQIYNIVKGRRELLDEPARIGCRR